MGWETTGLWVTGHAIVEVVPFIGELVLGTGEPVTVFHTLPVLGYGTAYYKYEDKYHNGASFIDKKRGRGGNSNYYGAIGIERKLTIFEWVTAGCRMGRYHNLVCLGPGLAPAYFTYEQSQFDLTNYPLGDSYDDSYYAEGCGEDENESNSEVSSALSVFRNLYTGGWMKHK